MPRPLRPLLFSLALVTLPACGRPPGGAQVPAATASSSSGGFILPTGGEAPTATANVERKVMRSGELSFRVDDAEAARREVLDRTRTAGGYVEADSLESSPNALLLTMTVSVPAGAFDTLLEALRTLGQLDHQQIEAVDVSAQMVDLEARLGVQRDVANRYRELIARAGDIGEVIALQRELAKVLGDTDSIAGQLHMLGENVAMSRLTIRCRARGPVDAAVGAGFTDAIAAGWNGSVRVLVGATYVWPLWILAASALVFARLRRRPATAAN